MCARRGEKFLRFVEKRPVLTLTILLTASAPGLWPTRERKTQVLKRNTGLSSLTLYLWTDAGQSTAGTISQKIKTT